MIGEGYDEKSNLNDIWGGETSHQVVEVNNDTSVNHSLETSANATSFDLLDLMGETPTNSVPNNDFDPFASHSLEHDLLLPNHEEHPTCSNSNDNTHQTPDDPFHHVQDTKLGEEMDLMNGVSPETENMLPTTAAATGETDTSVQNPLHPSKGEATDTTSQPPVNQCTNSTDVERTVEENVEKDDEALSPTETETIVETNQSQHQEPDELECSADVGITMVLQQNTKENLGGTATSQDFDTEGGIMEEPHGSAASSLLDEETPRDCNDKGPSTIPSQFQYSVMDIAAYQEQAEEIQRLREELENARATIQSLNDEKATKGQHEASLLLELQTSLQQQMSQRAEAENTARLAEARIKQLESSQQSEHDQARAHAELQAQLDVLMEAKAEAEDSARQLKEQINKLENENSDLLSTVQNLEKNITTILEEVNVKDQELSKMRVQRDEHHRKEMSLTSRLNEAKKKEADKANLAEQYEEDFKTLEEDLENTKHKLQEVNAENERLEEELKTVKLDAQQRIHLAEVALADERKLNEGRKAKMKNFIESKSEELRQAKADNESLQSELAQTNRSLMELNTRWKQLHAQWVQSQTRNRELQRDLNRIKKDSENLHKVGDTLEMKLSKSATETEEHKSKRLAAKHELMSVLRALESEKEISSSLRDSLKFTFTPKALSQQQLLREGLDDFDAQLSKLCQRLGKPVPPPADDAPLRDASDSEEPESHDMSNGDGHKVDGESARLVTKLEHETQRLSQCIMAILGNIERLHAVLDASGDRNCYTLFSELLSVGLPSGHREETQSITGREGGMRSIRSHRYGQVPSAASH